MNENAGQHDASLIPIPGLAANTAPNFETASADVS